MKINGHLNIGFSAERNRAGQRPLTIHFADEKGQVLFEVMGVRYIAGTVLDAVAQLPGGHLVYHTRTTPDLMQMLVKERNRIESAVEEKELT